MTENLSILSNKCSTDSEATFRYRWNHNSLFILSGKLGRLSVISTIKKMFCDRHLLSCTPSRFWNRSNLKQKYLLFFLFVYTSNDLVVKVLTDLFPLQTIKLVCISDIALWFSDFSRIASDGKISLNENSSSLVLQTHIRARRRYLQAITYNTITLL